MTVIEGGVESFTLYRYGDGHFGAFVEKGLNDDRAVNC